MAAFWQVGGYVLYRPTAAAALLESYVCIEPESAHPTFRIAGLQGAGVFGNLPLPIGLSDSSVAIPEYSE